MVAQLDNDKNVQVLKKPVAGEVREVVVGSELDVSFDFDLDSVQASKDGDDLVLTFEDESVLKLLGFADELEPVDVVLQDGTVLSAEAIMEAIGDDGFIDTAASASSSSPHGSGSSSLEGFGEALAGLENQEISHSYDDSEQSSAFSPSSATADVTPPAIGPVDLTATSDSGVSDSDNLTNITSPTFTGTAEPYAVITLYEGTTVLGTAKADGSGAWSITVPSLLEGLHNIQATATDAYGNTSPRTEGLPVEIDTTTPDDPQITFADNSSSDGGVQDGYLNADEVSVGDAGTAKVHVDIPDGARAGDHIKITATNSETGAEQKFSITLTEDQVQSGVDVEVDALGEFDLSVAAHAFDDAGNISGTTTETIHVDTEAPDAPGIDLISDSGWSRKDDPDQSSKADEITKDRTPTFAGSEGEAGSTITLYDGDPSTGSAVVLGTTIVNADRSWSVTVERGHKLADGDYRLYTTATDIAGNESAGSPLKVTIDKNAPDQPILSAPEQDNDGANQFINSDDAFSTEGEDIAGAQVVVSFPQEDGVVEGDQVIYRYTLGGREFRETVTITDGHINAGSVPLNIPVKNNFEGNVDVRVRFQDVAGNKSGWETEILHVDTQAPELTTNSAILPEIGQDVSLEGMNSLSVGTLQSSEENVTFEIESGNDNEWFSITSDGQLTVTKAGLAAGVMNFEQDLGQGRTVAIKMTDKAGNVETQDFTLNVTDVNEAPEVSVAEVTGTVTEAQTILGADGELHTTPEDPSVVEGKLTFTDVDADDVGNAEDGAKNLDYSVTSPDDTTGESGASGILHASGKYGHLEYNTNDGTWKYTLDDTLDATKELTTKSEAEHELFTVTASDGDLSVDQIINVTVNGKTDLIEYKLTFESQDADWHNALVVAVTDTDGTTTLYTDWSDSKDIDVGSTLQFSALEDAHVEYFLIPQATADQLDSLKYKNGQLDYDGKQYDHASFKVDSDESTGSTTYSFEDSGDKDYNDFVFSVEKSDADLSLEGTSGGDIFHGTEGNDWIVDAGAETLKVHDGSFTDVSEGNSWNKNGAETQLVGSNDWHTDSYVETVHRGDGSDRNYFVELDTHPSDSGGTATNIWQNIDTVEGTTYTLTFKAGAVERGDQLYVKIGGNIISLDGDLGDFSNGIIVTPKYSDDGTHWTTYTVTFVATSGETRVEFGQDSTTKAGNHDHEGVYLDDVIIQSGDDELYGHGGNDHLDGDLGDDLLVGGAGEDKMIGGEGFDTVSYAGDNGGVEGISFVKSGDDLTISGGYAEGDSVEGVEALIGTDHRDIIKLDNDWKDIDAGKGIDLVEINDSDGIDGVHVDLGEGGISSGSNSGAEIVKFISNGDIKAAADGGTGLDSLEIDKDGMLSAEITSAKLDGEGFNATVTAGAETNVLGKNFEQLKFNSASKLDVTIEDNIDHLDLYTAEDRAVETTITAEKNVGKISVTTGDKADTVTIQYQDDSFDKELDLHTWDGADDVTVSGDRVTGYIDAGDGGDTIDLSGITSGVVTVNAGDGDDTIYAGAAQETINGGDGDFDTVSYANSESAVTVDLSDANNDGHADATGSGGAEGDSYSSIENLTGSKYADKLTGNDDANVIKGGDVAPDRAIMTEDFDGHGTHNWAATSGSKEIHSHGTYNRNTNSGQGNVLEVDAHTAVDAISTTVETVAGQEYVFTFKALIRDNPNAAQNETLIVKIGAEEFTVIPTRDDQSNDAGNLFETYSIRFNGSGNSTVITFTEPEGQSRSTHGVLVDDIKLETIDDVIHGGAGNDTIFGEGGHDVLFGDEGADTIDGGIGNDIIEGGAGNGLTGDEFKGDTIDGGDGIDTASYKDSDAGVTVTLSDANQNGSAAGGHAEGDTLTSIENLIGSAHADILTGNDQANQIDGGAGADTIHGGIGNDVLYGGDNDISTRELIDDGSFGGLSDNVGASWNWNPPADHLGVVGDANWTVDNGIEVHHNGSNFYVEVDNYGYGEFISQKIETDADGTYTLNFDAWNESSNGSDGIKVDILDSEGKTIHTEIFSGHDINSSAGHTESFSFKAADGYTTVRFYQDGDVDGSIAENGISLDNVSVVKASGDHLVGGEGHDILNGGAGDLDVLNGGSGDDIFLFTSDDFKESGQTTFIQDFVKGEDSLQFTDVISGNGEEQYAVSDVSHSGGDTTFTVTATQAGSTEALTHTIVLQDDISMDHAYLQHLLNSGS